MAVTNFNDCNGYGAHFISTGSAITLPLPFDPDSIKVYNFTKFATNDKNLISYWFKDMPAGDAMIVSRATTALGSIKEATNGVTEADTAGGQADSHVAITGATAADPVVITAAGHGLVNGQRLTITKVLGMTQLNAPSRNPYVANNVTSTTFELQDIKGNDIDGSAFTAYTSGGQVNKVVNADFVAPTFNLLLGTAVIGDDGDELFVEAFKYSLYEDLGDAADF